MGKPCYINDLLITDVLREIFTQLTIEDNSEYLSYPFYDARLSRTPLLLTHVCSHWRKTALATPALWSSLRIDIEALLVPSGRQELYRTWLDRAWGTPVSLDIVDIRESRSNILDTTDWLGFLIEHVPYLQNLSVGPCVGNALIRGLLSKPKGTARHLRGLSISFPTHIPFAPLGHGKLSTLFPNLSQLDLSLSSYDGLTDIPVNQLTHLSCDIGFIAMLLVKIDGDLTLSRLMELHLYEAEFGWRDPWPKQIVLPEAQLIKIYDTGEDVPVARRILPIIQCPSLKVLHIDKRNFVIKPIPPTPPDSGDFSFFITFLSQAPCLRYFVARHHHFLNAAFLKHEFVRARVDAVSISTPLRCTVERAKQVLGEEWIKRGLSVAFAVEKGREGHVPAAWSAFVGWSRLPGHPIGRTYPRSWAPAFWDQGAYVDYVSRLRGSCIIPY
ncbi:hypothetical protein NMY22_g2530 [Coprinellus aureogranulatus]|nr:hypothetical protein NMY22_g2530 [Coprinellus aureogranulatus]